MIQIPALVLEVYSIWYLKMSLTERSIIQILTVNSVLVTNNIYSDNNTTAAETYSFFHERQSKVGTPSPPKNQPLKTKKWRTSNLRWTSKGNTKNNSGTSYYAHALLAASYTWAYVGALIILTSNRDLTRG